MSTPELSDYQGLNDERDQVIKSSDLPLYCPMDDQALWCAHPRVYLSIEDSADKTVRCPYCGTLYRLLD